MLGSWEMGPEVEAEVGAQVPEVGAHGASSLRASLCKDSVGAVGWGARRQRLCLQQEVTPPLLVSR